MNMTALFILIYPIDLTLNKIEKVKNIVLILKAIFFFVKYTLIL